MEYKPLEITVVSAKGLNDVNLISTMDVYAVVWINADPRNKQRTHVDKDCGKNPTWNFPVRFNVDSNAVQQNRLILHFLIRSERILGDRDIGEIQVPIKDLLDGNADGKSAKFVSYQVRKPSGKPKGVLNFSYKFGEAVSISPAARPSGFPVGTAGKRPDEPVTAYPAPSSSVPYPAPGNQYPPAGYQPAGYPPVGNPPAGYAPPPRTGYGYGQPQQVGYGYGQPQQVGYGYAQPAPYGYPPVVQQQRPNKNKFGMGLGAGLLGGALGGMLIGDAISDAGAYDSGYDAGFDDGGGFDF